MLPRLTKATQQQMALKAIVGEEVLEQHHLRPKYPKKGDTSWNGVTLTSYCDSGNTQQMLEEFETTRASLESFADQKKVSSQFPGSRPRTATH
jgi:hypothetical protein